MQTRAVYAGFAVFGGFWGAWGGLIPAIRDQAGISNGQLGTALLFIGAGALPAMLLTGRRVDRWGQPAAGVLLPLLGVVGVVLAATARDLTSLSVGLAMLGASSGAADVAINTVAGAAQQASGRPIIPRAHATFSGAVVVSSLFAGTLRALGAPLVTAFALLAVGSVVVAMVLIAGTSRQEQLPLHPNSGQARHVRLPVAFRPLLVLGGLGALAFAVENGHQSWSALYLQDALRAGPATAAAGPAVFAAVVAVSRLAASRLITLHPSATLLFGSTAAAAGTTIVGAAPTVPIGLLGLGVAAAGTGVLFPTLLGILTDRVPDGGRGTATSIVTSVAYLGFLAGPVYVGQWADKVALRVAMFALAALAAALALLALAALRALALGGMSWSITVEPTRDSPE